MGYDINLRIRVYPADQYDAVCDALSEEHRIELDNHWTAEDQSFAEGREEDTRWSGLTEDMKALSKKFPTATIQAYIQGEDGQEWVEWFRNGKHYEFGRPEWTGHEDPVDETLFK